MCAALAAAFALAGCWDESSLPDTLMFPPGLDIQYQGHSAKLYGTAQCAQGQLTGNSCLIFPPHAPRATGIIITAQQVHEVPLTARLHPHDPTRYQVLDPKGQPLLQTTGRHDEQANIDISPR